MDDILIRPVEPGDLPIITAIYGAAVSSGTSSYELDPPDLAEMTRRHAALAEAGMPYVAATDGTGRVLGYAYAGPFRPRPAYRFVVEDSIYIDADARGRGLGRLLLSALIEMSGSLGYRQMVAVIGDGRPESASVRLHERLGFSHAGTLRGTGYKFGRWLDTTFMQLEMNGGAGLPPDPDSAPERRYQASLRPSRA